MPATALALFSGSLDSLLAVRVLQEQGWRVEAVYFRLPCHDHENLARQAAESLAIELVVAEADEQFVELLRRPAHGFGRGANPCLDCRIRIFRSAEAIRARRDIALVISGEVLGQHPMTQKRRDLDLVAEASGLGARLLRPLSAALLRPTLAERQGLVDRQRLLGFSGRSRKPLRALAARLGLPWIPQSSPGCALAEPVLAGRVRELLAASSDVRLADLELLKLGRQQLCADGGRIVLGRNHDENQALERWFVEHGRRSALLQPVDFSGPTAVIVGAREEKNVALALELIRRRGGAEAQRGRVVCQRIDEPDELMGPE